MGRSYGLFTVRNELQLALCQTLKSSRLAVCRVDLSDGKAPEWIQLMPAGDVKAFDGRAFKNPTPQKVVDLFRTNGLDLPLDWEHASELLAPKGGKAPAAGWITDLEVRDGSIWGKIDWTSEGQKSVIAREYRYVSPGFYHDKSGNVVGMSSAGLTNKPALKLAELAREGDPMNPELLKLLGLADGATDTDVVAAVQALMSAVDQAKSLMNENKTAIASAQKEAETLKAKVAETETQLATARAATPGLDKFVPRQDYELAVARISKLEADTNNSLALAHQQVVTTEIEAAAKAGKITPATTDFYRKQCATKDGLELFREFIKIAPTVVADTIVTGEVPKTGDKKALTSEERTFIATMGLSEDEYRAGAM